MPARRKSLAELEASGSLKHDPARYKDRIENEPRPPEGVLAKPTFLTPVAEKHWEDFRKTASDTLRVLAESDAFALAMLAEAFAEWRDAVDKVNKEKSLLPSNRRNLDRAHNRFLKMLQEFGMTPAARAKVRVTGKPEKPSNRYSSLYSKRGQPYQEPS